jgi:hypothetical protein
LNGANGGSTVVEHSSHHPRVKGSNPATGNVFFLLCVG